MLIIDISTIFPKKNVILLFQALLLSFLKVAYHLFLITLK